MRFLGVEHFLFSFSLKICNKKNKRYGGDDLSKRRTRVLSVNIAAGTFASYEEAVKEANAIKIWLQRLCSKKGYSCKAIIGVSRNNPAVGSITTKKRGRGRPLTTFVRKSKLMKPADVDAHIHIVLLGNPASTIADELAKRLNKKYRKRVAWVKDCSGYVRNAVSYVVKQSLKVRTLDYDPKGILATDASEYDVALGEAMEEYRNIAFTKKTNTPVAKTLETKGETEKGTHEKEPPCNANKADNNKGINLKGIDMVLKCSIYLRIKENYFSKRICKVSVCYISKPKYDDSG